MDSNTATLLAVLGGSIVLMIVLAIVLYVLLAIALWKIFAKFGEPGWKGWIPFYNLYIQFKYTWNTKMYWILLILVIVGAILQGIGASTSGMVVTLGGLVELVGIIIMLIDEYKLYVSFGHGAGWFILSLFFPNIMTLVLGFGSSLYIGKQE